MADRTTHYRLNKPTTSESLDISKQNENMDIIDSELYERVKSLNGIEPDENGNIVMNTVPLAENLTSSYNQTSQESFVVRTTSGSSSVSDGAGTLESIMGERVLVGYVPYVLTMDVTLAQRQEEEDGIVVTKDDDVFLESGAPGGTITITYDGGWSASPAQKEGEDPLEWYGISVLGTPKNGDEIVLHYTEAVLGTIVQSSPTAFVSTGWNLYNHLSTYARVARYSETQGYRITPGSYSSIRFSDTLEGEKTVITPDANGNFNVPSDGYIWVQGGNNTSTAIWAVWGDWASGYVGAFQTYREQRIDLSSVMSQYFPHGLMRVGNYRDEINLSTGVVTSVIERLDNDSEGVNLTAAKNSGRPYEYDSNYVYVVRGAAVTGSVAIDNSYTMSDHGTELFAGTDVPVLTRTIYGANLKNKLERDVLTISAQSLSTTQKNQVLSNIGAAPASLAQSISQVLTGLFKVVTYKYTVNNVPAQDYTTISAANFGITAIAGYTPLCIRYFSTGSHRLVVYSLQASVGGDVMKYRNITDSAKTATATVQIVWVKTSAIG